jgi:hypothetical protein
MRLIGQLKDDSYVVMLDKAEAQRLLLLSGFSGVPKVGENVPLGQAFNKTQRFIELSKLDGVQQAVDSLKLAIESEA